MASEQQHTDQEQIEPHDLTGQGPRIIEVEDLRAIDDPLERQKRMDASIRENIAPFPEPIRLMQADGFTMYAVGWSISDLLIDQINDEDGSIISKNHPLGSFATHAPWYLNEIPLSLLQEVRRTRPRVVIIPPGTARSPSASK